ncbi:MAG TPA: pilus assembly protein TadG-related protein [Candidatus Hypogeohydataceae bacterium YC41]
MKYIGNNSGAVMIIVAASIVALLGMLALSADMGYLFLAKNQLQNAADAGAHAGVTKLTYFYGATDTSAQIAENEAKTYAEKHLAADRLVESTDVTVDISSNPSAFGVGGYTGIVPAIRVTVSRTQAAGSPVTLFFAGVLGQPKAGVQAVAVARLAPLLGTCEFAPWAIRDQPQNAWGTSNDWVFGQSVTLKFGAEQVKDTDAPGWFNPVDFPPENKTTTCGGVQTGANAYRDNIKRGSSCDRPECFFGEGDTFNIETGNMAGPTVQAVSTDSDSLFNQGKLDVNVLLYLNHNSNHDVTISRIGTFHITSIQTTGNNKGDITGTFVATTSGGMPGTSGAASLKYIAQLIK